MKVRKTTTKTNDVKHLPSILIACLTVAISIYGCRHALAKPPAYNAVATAELVRGINQNNADVFEDAVKRGANVNALGSVGGPAKRGLTALMIAASAGKTRTVKLLLSKGARVNYQGNLGMTALILATNPKGNVETVRLLLDKGAKINALNDDGFSALMFAAGKGKKEIVRLLLERRANVNVRARNGFTALMLTPNSASEVKQMLLAAGAH
jgi:ankyrin repeat protein